MTGDAPSPLDLAGDLVERALAAGANAADAIAFRDASLAANWRLGALEELERSESIAMGLRVFIGRRQAAVSTSDLSDGALAELVERAAAMARAAPEDEFAGLADAALLAAETPDLDLDADDEPAPERLFALAAEAEDAARSVEGVTNSEGAAAVWRRTLSALAASNGFQGHNAGTSSSVSVSVVAGEGLGMERDGESRSARHMADLPPPAGIGAEAGRRAVRRLNPGKLETGRMPVVFDDRCARSLLGHLAAAVSGPAVARGVSFLKDRMGKAVFAPGVVVSEDPLRRRGPRSRPFDGEGLPTRARRPIDDGVLTSWLLDCRSARQLGLEPTGHATRGPSGQLSPGPANLWLEPGGVSPEALMADIAEGFYCTDLIGFGVNGVTGDYSRGAAGFCIRNGRIAHPVSEVTVAGNLADMFARLVPADDLRFLSGIDAPHVRIDGMTVAGRQGAPGAET